MTAYLFYGFLETESHADWEAAYSRHWEDFVSATTFELRTHVVFGLYGTASSRHRFLSESTATFFTEDAFPLEDESGTSPLAVSGLYLRSCEGRVRDQAAALGIDLGSQVPRWWLVSYEDGEHG